MLIIHRPDQPDELISASEFRRRARETEQHETDHSEHPPAPRSAGTRMSARAAAGSSHTTRSTG